MEDDVDTSSTKQLVQFLETADEWSNVAEIVPTFKGNTYKEFFYILFISLDVFYAYIHTINIRL